MMQLTLSPQILLLSAYFIPQQMEVFGVSAALMNFMTNLVTTGI